MPYSNRGSGGPNGPGSAIGGGLGALAMTVNAQIFRSQSNTHWAMNTQRPDSIIPDDITRPA